jgi:hypothetical protein
LAFYSEAPADGVDAVAETGQPAAGDDPRAAASVVVDEHHGIVVFAMHRDSEL